MRGWFFRFEEDQMELYNAIIAKISDILYYPLVVPLLLVFAGVQGIRRKDADKGRD